MSMHYSDPKRKSERRALQAAADWMRCYGHDVPGASELFTNGHGRVLAQLDAALADAREGVESE